MNEPNPGSGSSDHPDVPPVSDGRGDVSDGGATVQVVEKKDWEWRRRVRANPQTHLFYRIVVGIVGLLVVILGLLMVPFPGPGWFVVILGLVIWASEFAWAQRLLTRTRELLKAWTSWVQRQALWVKALALVGIAILVAALFWVFFRVSGVPGFFPDAVEEWLKGLPGLAG